MPQAERHYRTSNLYEAAYLLSKGFPLLGKEQEGSRVIVLFLETPNIHEASLMFFNGEAKRLFDSFRSLKDFVFAK